MGKKNQLNKNYKRDLKNLSDKDKDVKDKICFSLIYFDRNQGQSWEEWEKDKLLSSAINKMLSITHIPLTQIQTNQIIKIYNSVDFPPKSNFKYPNHVPEGVKWASFHIQGKECIIGFFENNIFHIVFLDRIMSFGLEKIFRIEGKKISFF